MNATEKIDQLIAGIDDWRGKTLASIRAHVLATDNAITEEWKWMGSPAWYCEGLIAVANAHKDKVKITFSNGAKLADPDQLFNAGLGGKAWRAIDFFEGDKVNAAAFERLVRRAIAFNQARNIKPKSGTAKKSRKTTARGKAIGTT